jgi:hypothetical protein
MSYNEYVLSSGRRKNMTQKRPCYSCSRMLFGLHFAGHVLLDTALTNHCSCLVYCSHRLNEIIEIFPAHLSHRRLLILGRSVPQ